MLPVNRYLAMNTFCRSMTYYQKSYSLPIKGLRPLIYFFLIQEKLVFARLSYRIGTDILLDIGRGDEIHNRKLYTYRYSSVRYLS